MNEQRMPVSALDTPAMRFFSSGETIDIHVG